MQEKASGSAVSIGRSIAANAAQVCKDCGVGEMNNLMVEKGETVMLSYDSARFKGVFRQVKPQSIDEVRKLIGVESAVGARAGKSGECGCSKGRFLGEAELQAEDPAVRGKALSLTRAAARGYVMGAAAATPSQKAVLNSYIQLTSAVLNLAFLLDIEVQNGATLVLPASTHALYARKIRIHGTGRIVCHGPTTVNCTSIEGDYKKRFVGGIAADVNIGIIRRLEQ